MIARLGVMNNISKGWLCLTHRMGGSVNIKRGNTAPPEPPPHPLVVREQPGGGIHALSDGAFLV